MKLAAGDLHIFAAHIGPQPNLTAALLPVLSDAEREQAARFHFQIHCDRYIYAHAALHYLIGRYLEVPPAAIRFDTGPFGKPYLSHRLPADRKFFFNMSHSSDLAVLAFAWDFEIGVDTEWIDPDIELAGLAETVFTASELRNLYAAPDQHRHFFDLWARKEAYAKALGMGLQIPFKELEIGQRSFVNGLRIQPFEPAKGFAAAIATPHQVHPPKVLQFRFGDFL